MNDNRATHGSRSTEATQALTSAAKILGSAVPTTQVQTLPNIDTQAHEATTTAER